MIYNFSFELVILSALFHTLWNIFLKRSSNKILFTRYMIIMSFFMATVVMVIFFRDHLFYDRDTFMYACFSAFFFSLYQLFVASAYEYGDVSLIYPITTSSPLFIVILSYLILGEIITIQGFFGILMIIFGCFLMNMTKGKGKFELRAVIFAFIAALIYSFGAINDKIGVTKIDPILYIYIMMVFLAIFSPIFSIFFLRFQKKDNINEKEEKINWKLLILASLTISLSTATFRLGLIGMPIAYATSIRQVSSLFGLLIGIYFFKEKSGFKRFIGCMVILLGVVLIRLDS